MDNNYFGTKNNGHEEDIRPNERAQSESPYPLVSARPPAEAEVQPGYGSSDSPQPESAPAAPPSHEPEPYVEQGTYSYGDQNVYSYSAPEADSYGYAYTVPEQPAAPQSQIDYYTAPQPSYATPQSGEQKKPKKKKERKRVGAGIVALCLIVSLLGGFGGAYLYGALAQNGAGDAPPVVYETPSNTPTSTAPQTGNSVADVAAQNGESVVEISTETMATSSYLNNYVTQGAGSGVVLTADGYIVTCAHVISGATNVKVTLSDGVTYDAEVIGSDSVSDIAVLKINATGLKPVVLGDSNELVVGQQIIVIGNPLGSLGGSVTNGIISALEREVIVSSQAMTLLQTNAAINPGNSGGAMFNEDGELVGIVNAKSAGSGVEGLGFAIPINDAKPIIESLMENGYVSGRPALGVEVIDITSGELAAQYGVSRYGVLIAGVPEGGGAASAGIQAGDFLVSIDDNAVNTVADITPILQNYEVGDRVSVQVIRNNKTLSFTVTLNELGA